MKVILIVVFSITIIKILPPLASVLRSPKVTGPGYRTSVLQLGPRDPLTWASNAGGIGKNRDSQPISGFRIDDW